MKKLNLSKLSLKVTTISKFGASTITGGRPSIVDDISFGVDGKCVDDNTDCPTECKEICPDGVVHGHAYDTKG